MPYDNPFSRRDLLLGGLRLSAFAGLAAAAHSTGAAAPLLARDERRRTLVVVQLSGGNDGLNTVVPFRQDAYFRLRPSISLAPGSLHRLDDEHGLHPDMRALSEVFAEGQLAIVHGVGYPEPDRSHFRSMQVWHTADPSTAYGAGAQRPDVGWLGRLTDELGGGMPALHLGDGDLPLALKTRLGFTPTVRDARGFLLTSPRRGNAADFERTRASLLRAGPAEGALATLRAAAASTYDAAARMRAFDSTGDQGSYPNHALAQRLGLCANLIAGGFGTRIFGLELGGFDTHALQLSSQAALLRELSESLAAFQRDLAAKGVADQVTTLVFSEFGRRVEENASKGSDHGAAGPVFVIGAGVRGGLVGTPPDLSDLTAGDIAYTTDFRSIYSALERDWLGLEPGNPIAPLPGLI